MNPGGNLSGEAVALLLAGGSGRRMSGRIEDKILAPIGGIPVFRRCVDAFLKAGVVREFVVVCRDGEQQKRLRSLLSPAEREGFRFVPGGAERYESVRLGLAELPEDAAFVFIHDGARPLVHPRALEKLGKAVRRNGAAVLAHRVVDTIKRAEGAIEEGSVPALEDLDRSRLWAMETPQVFRVDWIRDGYERACSLGQRPTDDVAALFASGRGVEVVENPRPNPKLTHPADFAVAEALLSYLDDWV